MGLKGNSRQSRFERFEILSPERRWREEESVQKSSPIHRPRPKNEGALHRIMTRPPIFTAFFLVLPFFSSRIECSNPHADSLELHHVVETQKVTTDDWHYYVPSPRDTHGEDKFGGAIALHGNTAAVQLIRGRDWFSGDVFVMTKKLSSEEWISQGIVKAWDGDGYDNFGSSIAIYENTLVVGSPYDDYYSNERIGDPGGVYVFTRSFINRPDGSNKNKKRGVWNGHTKLQPQDAPISSSSCYFFGHTVAIVKDTIAVGAIQENRQKAIPGSVYIFSKQEESSTIVWKQVAKYTPWDDEIENNFGTSLALTEDLLVVGACSGKNDGAVYVFYNNGSGNSDWSQGVKLQVSIPDSDTDSGERSPALFGRHSVAAAGNTIVVGAPGLSNQRGAVYVYTRDSKYSESWHRTIIVAEDSREHDFFGLKVDISPDELIITVGAGVLYVSKTGRFFCDRFRRTRDGWIHVQRIVPSDAIPYMEYGRSFAVSHDTLMVTTSGLARSENEEERRGAAYVFKQGKMPGPMPPAKETTGKQGLPPTPTSQWMNLFVSLLLIYVIHTIFLRNDVRPPTA